MCNPFQLVSSFYERKKIKTVVVSKMVILTKTSNYQKCIKKTNKIPDYARGYKNEYLMIRGINKTCGKFVKLIKENEEFYNGTKALKIISKIKKFKSLVCLKNISKIVYEFEDVKNILFIRSEIEKYKDLYCDPYTGKLNKKKYNIEAEVDNPGFKSFYKHFCRFYDDLEIGYLFEYYNYLLQDLIFNWSSTKMSQCFSFIN